MTLVRVYFCNDCETGQYMNVTGVSAYLYCPTGTTADETASTTCRACAPSSSTATLGAVICNNCSVGSYQKVSGQTSCVSCNAGFFVPSFGQTACQACEPGFANDQEEADLCYSCSSSMYSSLYNQTSLSRFYSLLQLHDCVRWCHHLCLVYSLDVAAPGDCSSAINPKVQHRPMFLPAIPFLVEADRMLSIDGGQASGGTAPLTGSR